MGKNNKPKRRRSVKIPLATVAGFGAAIMPSVQAAIAGNLEGAADMFVSGLTGYSYTKQNFDIMRLKRGLLPIMIGGVASMAASKLGINARLRDIPFVKV